MSTAQHIYTSQTLHSIPHRWRVSRILRLLRSLSPADSFADVGCCDGFVTVMAAAALRCSDVTALDYNQEVLEQGRSAFPSINFQQWDLCSAPLHCQFSVVTCMETLEHVRDLETAVRNLLAMTRDVLIISVPIEVGAIGTAKTLAKLLAGRTILTDEHRGLTLREYFLSLLLGHPIIHFRNNRVRNEWSSHTGFDYRYLGRLLRSTGLEVDAVRYGWNIVYALRK